jgi:uncharacterized protein
MNVMLAMAHIQAKGVGSRLKQRTDFLRPTRRGTKRGEDADLAIAGLKHLRQRGKLTFSWGMLLMDINAIDDKISDRAAAAAFRHLVRHLQHRSDAANIDLMGLAGFCRNCLGDWLAEADPTLTKEAAREAVHGMSAADWKASQPPATPEQLAKMEESLAKNAPHG